MKSSSPAAGPSLSLERLARKLYEDGNAGGKPWLRLGWDVRESWLDKARASLDAPGANFDWFFLGRIARLFT